MTYASKWTSSLEQEVYETFHEILEHQEEMQGILVGKTRAINAIISGIVAGLPISRMEMERDYEYYKRMFLVGLAMGWKMKDKEMFYLTARIAGDTDIEGV